MKVPEFIAACVFAGMLGLQGWTLVELVSLKVEVAKLTVQIAPKLASNE